MATRRNPRAFPLGSDLAPTITRMKEIVAQSEDALITEGPVHPDHALLALCHEIAERRKLAEGMEQEYRSARSFRRDLYDVWMRAERAYAVLLRRAGKIRAKTPAGIYAKAIAVRASRTGAAVLARSLAEDLIACEGLRASLWPAEIAE